METTELPSPTDSREEWNAKMRVIDSRCKAHLVLIEALSLVEAERRVEGSLRIARMWAAMWGESMGTTFEIRKAGIFRGAEGIILVFIAVDADDESEGVIPYQFAAYSVPLSHGAVN